MMKIEQLFILMALLLSFVFKLNSQCGLCSSYGAVQNGDFETVSADPICQPPGNDAFYGQHLITAQCSYPWIASNITPDLINPNMGFNLIDPFITSNMGGLCYLPAHSQGGEGYNQYI